LPEEEVVISIGEEPEVIEISIDAPGESSPKVDTEIEDFPEDEPEVVQIDDGSVPEVSTADTTQVENFAEEEDDEHEVIEIGGEIESPSVSEIPNVIESFEEEEAIDIGPDVNEAGDDVIEDFADAPPDASDIPVESEMSQVPASSVEDAFSEDFHQITDEVNLDIPDSPSRSLSRIEPIPEIASDFISSVEELPRPAPLRETRPPPELKFARPFSWTIRGRKEQQILTQHRQTQFSLPPAKKPSGAGDRTASLFEPKVLSSASLRDVNSAYRNSVRNTQQQLSLLNQSISGMLLTRRVRDQEKEIPVITLDGARREIEARIETRRRKAAAELAVED
jgi:hypothetical protein